VIVAGPKKRCLGPQNDLGSLGLEKLEKNTKMKIEAAKMTSICEPFGIGGWPLISTEIKIEKTFKVGDIFWLQMNKERI
jgi:hypothetical protein